MAVALSWDRYAAEAEPSVCPACGTLQRHKVAWEVDWDPVDPRFMFDPAHPPTGTSHELRICLCGHRWRVERESG